MADARRELVFHHDRDQLIESGAQLANLVPGGLDDAGEQTFCCPVQGCARGKHGEHRQTLATHLLADHFAHCKTFR